MKSQAASRVGTAEVPTNPDGDRCGAEDFSLVPQPAVSRCGIGAQKPWVHSITSLASASNCGGTLSPSAFAVFVLITGSNLVGCSTGRSPGFAPLRILSTKVAAPAFSQIDPVNHQSTFLNVLTIGIYSRQAHGSCQCRDSLPLTEHQRLCSHQHCLDALLNESLEGNIDVHRRADLNRHEFDTQRCRSGLGVSPMNISCRIVDVH
jgi:hypothetical protein